MKEETKFIAYIEAEHGNKHYQDKAEFKTREEAEQWLEMREKELRKVYSVIKKAEIITIEDTAPDTAPNDNNE